MGNKYTIILSTAALLTLSACSGKPLFGGPLFDRSAPDEFAVLSAQPLTMPPEFRLPTPGEETPASRKRIAADRVGTALLRGEKNVESAGSKGLTAGESAFLQSLSAGTPDVPQAPKAPAPEKKKNTYLLPGFFGGSDSTSADIIDPAAERARIEEAKKQGEDITGDGAESHKERKDGLIQRWFKD